MTPAQLGLYTDLYEMTMAQTYFAEGMVGRANFGLFARTYPPNRGFFVCAGLEDALEFLEGFTIAPDAVDYLWSTGMFSSEFLEFIGSISFTGRVRALPEGRIFFANEPILEVDAPMIEAQLVETLLINRLNFQSLQATKAARCVLAAKGRVVSDFGARRSPGVDSGLSMARSGYIAGFQSTSNVLAARNFAIPPAGTMAHSMITAFPTELDAFRAYARSFPHRTILLLDTYDTVQGAINAAQVGRDMEANGHRLAGVRLDSGDYAQLSRQVRQILDDAGLTYVAIVASGGIDEYEIEDLVNGGAPIDVFGVGTRVTTSADAPYTDMSYKLACYQERPVMKLSPEKISPPGSKQVYRLKDGSGGFVRDVVALDGEAAPDGDPLLELAMVGGKRTRPAPSLEEVRQRFTQDIALLAEPFKAIRSPAHYPVSYSPALQQLTERLQGELLNTPAQSARDSR